MVCGPSCVCVGQVAVKFATLPTARMTHMTTVLMAPPGQPCACATVRHVALVFRRFFNRDWLTLLWLWPCVTEQMILHGHAPQCLSACFAHYAHVKVNLQEDEVVAGFCRHVVVHTAISRVHVAAVSCTDPSCLCTSVSNEHAGAV